MAFVSHLVKSCYPVRRVVTDRLVCRRTLWSIREGVPYTSFFEASTFTGSKFSPFWSPLALQEIQRKRPSSGCRLFCTSSNISKEASRFVEEAVEKDSVVVFAKSWCPYCARVKGLFQSLQVPFKAYDLDQMDIGDHIQAALLEKTGQRTVPNVFISKQHIGGCSETMELFENGTLSTLLKKANIHIA
ncbi:hypothetical protein GAYE_SCF06G2770 [Galdieria yellowstonensis]|uniref:Glutaredoxin domain-containing protein n=1 Tax=Galdieria yellowstonensis TaxID=3028027 RepID=A0AAV9IC10_9RHOD|nr:hypothetical protein GAYE_SCF06G2770 [Galdieria yellowstonensis]